MKCVIHRLEHSPDNAGHWQRSVALAVLLGRVPHGYERNRLVPSVKRDHTPANIRAAWEALGLGDVLNDRRHFATAFDPEHLCQILGSANYSGMFRGAADRCWVHKELEPKRRRLSVNKGTREARLSMVVTKHLPMRQPSGGAPVVVRDVNDVHMAKGCRMVCAGQPNGSPNREASR